MLKRSDVLSIGYLKKTTFSGSFEGVRFLLKKDTREEETILRVYAWPEPYAFVKTNPDDILTCEKDFTEAGILSAIDWLNEVHDRVAKH